MEKSERDGGGGYRHVGVAGAALGVSGREDSVDKDEGADDLSGKASSLGVVGVQLVGSASIANVVSLLEAFDEGATTDCTQTPRDHVQKSTDQRYLSGEEQTKGHRGVNVTAWW